MIEMALCVIYWKGSGYYNLDTVIHIHVQVTAAYHFVTTILSLISNTGYLSAVNGALVSVTNYYIELKLFGCYYNNFIFGSQCEHEEINDYRFSGN